MSRQIGSGRYLGLSLDEPVNSVNIKEKNLLSRNHETDKNNFVFLYFRAFVIDFIFFRLSIEKSANGKTIPEI